MIVVKSQMMCANLLDLRDKGDPCMKLKNFKGVDLCALYIVRLPLSHQNVLAEGKTCVRVLKILLVIEKFVA